MKITRTSPLTGKCNTLDLNITEEQLDKYINGTLVQKAFTNLTADEREFFISGLMPKEFDEMFSHQGEEEDSFFTEEDY